MYSLTTPLAAVTGIGPKMAAVFRERNLNTVKDFLLFIPLRYEDRSTVVTIDQLLQNPSDELVTLQARVHSKNNYYRGRRSIQSATINDDTAKLKLMWFNNKFIIEKLKVGEEFLFSGKLNDRKMMIQAVVEDVKDDTIHTGRLVPRYSLITEIKDGTLRRLLKHILDNLKINQDSLDKLETTYLPLLTCFSQLHFPDDPELVIKARERLALEELLSLMKKSHLIKEQWVKGKRAQGIRVQGTGNESFVPKTVPFELTPAQLRATQEILTDLNSATPMNRLLVGDVGSGKTVVAGIAAFHTLAAGHSVALIAPTRILAEQHAETLTKIFPTLSIELITGGGKKASKVTVKATNSTENSTLHPTLYIGTHAVINRLSALQPALIIYDEQHRFGVAQRSAAAENSAHILTMSATPIPRSLMLTIFSHLSLSVIDELPKGRLPIKTWLVPESKRKSSYEWIQEELKGAQALVICPFIDPSNSQALENVAAVTDKFEEIQGFFGKSLQVGLLHGRMKKAEQDQVTEKLYSREIDILVTTPIVEVGVDLPAANIIIIEASERFGLASLHQLRGRVGRAGQQAYCLLFTNTKSTETKDRLQKFSQISNGRELAELDLHHRGAGDIFGTQQHGFDDLRFATWANFELISQARIIYDQLAASPEWEPFFEVRVEAETTPQAN